MAKNELLPFADGEDANVLPTNQWEALTDILENGFQSGIARSEQVNRVLAQGAVASYVLGQLIVDQLNKDATLNKDTLYQNLVSALQENAKDVCLPLSGGTMTGKVVFLVGDAIAKDDSTSELRVYGGTNIDNGATLFVYGKDSPTSTAGGFRLRAHNGSAYKDLVMLPDGTLNWNLLPVMVSNNLYGNAIKFSSIANGISDACPSGGTWTFYGWYVNSSHTLSFATTTVAGGGTYVNDTGRVVMGFWIRKQ